MIELFEPHDGQKEILDKFVVGKPEIKWGVITTGRQFGKTLLAMNSIAYWLLNEPGALGVWITPYVNQGIKVFDEFREALNDIIVSSNRTLKEVTLSNGSKLIFRSAENYEALRGYTFDYGIMDEAAYIKSDAMKVIRPTFVIKGKKIMVISTPWVKNWFYDYHQQGYNDEFTDVISFKAKSTDNPFFPLSEIAAARESLPEDVIQQEYFAEFSVTDGTVFSNFAELCDINEYQGSSDEECYIGVDIALGGADFTCVVVMNARGQVICIERWKESVTERQIQMIDTLIGNYNVKGGFIEINQERGIQQTISKKHNQIREWVTTKKSKPVMIQNLKKDIEDKVLRFPTKALEPVFWSEMSKFTYEKKEDGYIKYGHPEGGHDDTVVALALANEARVPNRHIRRSFLADFNAYN